MNGLLTINGVKGMLEQRQYHTVDLVFSFFAVFLDYSTECTKRDQINDICMCYSDNLNDLLPRRDDMIWHTMKNILKNI